MHPSGFAQVWIRELVDSTFVPMIYYHCASSLHKQPLQCFRAELLFQVILFYVGFDRSEVFLF